MPEGDTVWQTAKRLHAALAGKVLTRSDLRVPKYATADLTGRTVLDVTPRGKHLLTRIEGGLTLHSHLRMDGTWRVYANGQRWSGGGPAHQIRVILGTADRTAVGYRLPVLELLRTTDENRVVGHLGPDLLGPDWNPELALANLLADPTRPSARPCSTSATWPASATSTKANSASSSAPPLAPLRRTPRRPRREAARHRQTPLGGQPRPPHPQHHKHPHEQIPKPKPHHRPEHPDPPHSRHPRFRPRHPRPPRSRRPHLGPRRPSPPRAPHPRHHPLRPAAHPHTPDLFVYGRAPRPCLRCSTPIRTANQGDGSRDRPTYWCPTCQIGPAPAG